MTRPAKLPFWADTGTIVEPSTARKHIGWRPLEAPPFGWENYLMDQFSDWIEHLQGSGKETDMATAVSGVPVGEHCILDEHDMDAEPGTTVVDTDTGTNVNSIDVTAKSIVYIETGGAAAFAKARDTTTAVATYTKSGAGVNNSVRSNGVYTVICYGTLVDFFDHDTGALLWTYDHTANVYDVDLDGTNVYLVGVTNATPETVVALDIAASIAAVAGVKAWGATHSGTLFSCCTDGKRVYVAGAASGLVTGATLRAIRADNGFDATGEMLVGADATFTAWDVVTTAVATYRQLATDGRSLWCSYTGAVPANLERRSVGDGTVLASIAIPNTPTVRAIAVDHELVTIAYNDTVVNNLLDAYDHETLALVWRWADGTANMNAAATDGGAVFCGLNTGGAPSRSLCRVIRGNRSGLWRRVDPTLDDFLPFHQLIVSNQ